MVLEQLEKIRSDVLGRFAIGNGPYGSRRLVYADYAASGRGMQSVERFVKNGVLPWYANTHSNVSWTGQQTNQYREQARERIRRFLGASGQDALIFCGGGSTGAIEKLIACLCLRIPCKLEDKYQLSQHIPQQQRPVVFVGPYEHHSNELPWRETIADVCEVKLAANGSIDLEHLASLLSQYRERPLKIGSFSAASNVTGILTDVDSIAELLHAHGACAFFDYATAGPHVPISMNPPDRPQAYKDAVFLSPHKFIGGPGATGILVAKRHLFSNRVPSSPGGGTVRFVSPEKHVYTAELEHREEGGTPNITGDIRAWAAFELKQSVQPVIRDVENAYREAALRRWSNNPNIKLLGNPSVPSLPILSFQVTHQGKPLHYGFVTKLLSDLFGVQVRGGCSCAGPYAHRLLDMKAGSCNCLETWSSIKPGWTRVSMSYAMTPEEVQYVIDAVDAVASLGWRMLPAYCFDVDTGEWSTRKGNFEPRNLPTATQILAPPSQDKCTAMPLRQAMQEGLKTLQEGAPEFNIFCSIPDELRHHAWFWLPEQIKVEKQAPQVQQRAIAPLPQQAIAPSGAIDWKWREYWPAYAAIGAVAGVGLTMVAVKTLRRARATSR